MQKQIQFTRKIYKQGDSLVTTIPQEILQYLQLTEQHQIIITAQTGKHGKHITIYKKPTTKEETTK